MPGFCYICNIVIFVTFCQICNILLQKSRSGSVPTHLLNLTIKPNPPTKRN